MRKCKPASPEVECAALAARGASLQRLPRLRAVDCCLRSRRRRGPRPACCSAHQLICGVVAWGERLCDARAHRRNEGLKDMAANFKWEDPLLLEEQLTTEERLVRAAAREYAQDKLGPRIVEAFRREHTDPA